ncbi:MAG: hypothetical protein Q4F49_00225 [Pseudoxanthomonas suwonensis]|nr:hypothetical protein [Pseudoxanthomonas suwonensis]
MRAERWQRWYHHADFPPMAIAGMLLAMQGRWEGAVLLVLAVLLVAMNLTLLRHRPGLRLALAVVQVTALLAWALWQVPQLGWVLGILALWGMIIIGAVLAASRSARAKPAGEH